MSTTLALAAAFGALSGARSMAAPALVAHAFHSRPRRRPGPVEGLLSRRDVALGFGVAAAGEMVGDKLPFIPARIDPAPLGGRILFGALAGAAVAERGRHPAWAGALVGGAAAVAGAFTAYHLRRSAGQALAVPDTVLGAAEDVLVYGSGAALARSLG